MLLAAQYWSSVRHHLSAPRQAQAEDSEVSSGLEAQTQAASTSRGPGESSQPVRTPTAWSDEAVTQHPGLPRQKPAITAYTEIRGYLDIDICFHDTTITN